MAPVGSIEAGGVVTIVAVALIVLALVFYLVSVIVQLRAVATLKTSPLSRCG